MREDVLQRQAYSVHALRLMAKRRLPRMVFDIADGAAGDEITMRRNEQAVADIELVPKVLNGAATRNQKIELFGHTLTSPVIVGPTGLAGLFWPKAEIAAARAAERFGTVYILSHASTCSIEEIGAATKGPKWMQVFIYKDRGITAEFAERAKASGYNGLVVTVDNQVSAGRDRDARNRMAFPLRLGLGNFIDLASRPQWLTRFLQNPRPTFVNYGKHSDLESFRPLMIDQLDPGVSWKDFDWLRSIWKGPLIIKGLLHEDEAVEAHKRGADTIIVSNHGGRQLDGAVPSVEALPRCVDALQGRLPVLVDGGFRRGVDVVKALALGAHAVLIGRPQLWGVATAGESGVHWVLELYRREIDRAMALGGWDGVAALNRSIISASKGALS